MTSLTWFVKEQQSTPWYSRPYHFRPVSRCTECRSTGPAPQGTWGRGNPTPSSMDPSLHLTVCSQLLYNHWVSLGTPSSGPIWVVTKVCEPKFIHDSEGCLKFWNCLKNINKVSTCTVRLPWTVWTQGKHRLNSSLWVLWIESPVLVHLNSKMEVVAYIHVYLLNSRLVNGLDRIEVFMTNHDQDKT